VVHLNVADFAVAVERLVDRSLADRPLIIAPEGAARAIVHDMSEEAYQAGVRKGMPLARARRACRDAVCRPPRPARYERAMAAFFREALPYSPLVEPGAIDGHLFIDLTGTSRLFGPPVDVAWRMYRRVRTCLGFCPIWTVAPNKLVAKVASRVVKPVGEYIVGEGEAGDFLSPLPVRLLPGMESLERRRLQELNLLRVNQVAALTKEQLEVFFGSRAGFIYDAVRGVDASPVRSAGEAPPKVTASCEFGDDTNEVAVVEGAVHGLVEKIGARLRKQGRAAPLLTIAIDYADGLRVFRRLSVRPPSANDITLFETARALLEKAWTRRVRIRHVRLVCSRPVAQQAQMELFAEARRERERRDAVIHAVDRIRDRFGESAVRLGRTAASGSGRPGKAPPSPPQPFAICS
jgi:DNA polymerase-4